MRVLLIASLLVAAGLVGCLGSGQAPLEPSHATTPPGDAHVPVFPNGTPAPLSHEIRDCQSLVHVQRAPAAVVEDELPPGFAVKRTDPAGELATVLFVGQACTWEDGSPVGIAKAYVLVDPPVAWQKGNGSGHGLYLSVITTSEELAARLTAWGLGAVVSVGNVTLEISTTPAGGTGHLEASAGAASLTVDTVATGPSQPGTGPVARMFVAEDGWRVTGAVDLHPGAYDGGLQGASQVSWSGFWQDGGPLPGYPAVGHLFWDAGQEEVYVDLPPLEGR